MQQSRSLWHFRVNPQVGSHDTGKVGDFKRVDQHVLSVRSPELQPSQSPHQLLIQIVNPRFEDRLFAGLPYFILDLRFRLFIHLLDPGRLNPSIDNQLLECQPSDLSPHRIKTGQYYRLGRVVDDEIYTGQVLEGPDVPTLLADYPSFNLVGGKRNTLYGCLCHVFRSTSLNSKRYYLPCPLLGLFTGPCLLLLDRPRDLEFNLILQGLDKVVLGFLGGHAGDFLEDAFLFSCSFCQFVFLGLEMLLPGSEPLVLLFRLRFFCLKALLSLHQPPLEPLQVASTALEFALGIGPRCEYLVLCFDLGFTLDVFYLSLRVSQDLFRRTLCRRHSCLRQIFTCKETAHNAEQKSDNSNYCVDDLNYPLSMKKCRALLGTSTSLISLAVAALIKCRYRLRYYFVYSWMQIPYISMNRYFRALYVQIRFYSRPNSVSTRTKDLTTSFATLPGKPRRSRNPVRFLFIASSPCPDSRAALAVPSSKALSYSCSSG